MKVQNITDIEGFFKAIDSCIIPVCITRDYLFKWRDSGNGNHRT